MKKLIIRYFPMVVDFIVWGILVLTIPVLVGLIACYIKFWWVAVKYGWNFL